MTSMTNGAVTVTPVDILGYKSARSARTVLHSIIGRSAPDVSFAPASLRRGTLETFFTSEAAALAAEQAHATPAVWTLIETGVTSIAMRYVVAEGEITRELDEGRRRWTVSIPFQEVP